MAKDPAFLFYPGDWLGGTMGMTFEEKGAYMELLILQFNRGRLSNNQILRIIGNNLWNEIKNKFTKDEEGLFYNKRLEDEQLKRIQYSDSRRRNRIGASVGENDSDNNSTKVYIMKDLDSGYIKIGASVNPKNRLSTIKSRQNKNVVLVAVADDCILADEKKLQKHFLKFNIKGDWFDLNEQDVINHMSYHMNKHMILHMEDENENKNKDIIKNKKVEKFSNEVKDCLEYCLEHFPIELIPLQHKGLDTWLKVIYDLNTLDHLSFDDILLIVKSARGDAFWSKNFLSLTKLRRKDKDGVPYWRVFAEKFKKEKTKTEKMYNAYEEAKISMGL